MFALQVLAAVMLFLSAACFFGPQLVIYGPRAFPSMLKQPQAKFVGGFLVTACVFAVSAPYFGGAMLQGGQRMSMVALDMMSMSFGVV